MGIIAYKILSWTKVCISFVPQLTFAILVNISCSDPFILWFSLMFFQFALIQGEYVSTVAIGVVTLWCWSLVVLHPPADLHYLSGRQDNFRLICREKWIWGKTQLPILFEKQIPHHTIYMMYMHRYLSF